MKKEIIFANSEEYIKTYRYYSSTIKNDDKGEIERNLIVTSKRLILESTNNSGFNRDEILLDNVERIDTNFLFSKKGSFGIVALILGVLFSVAGFIIGGALDLVFSGFNYIFVGLGAVLFISGLLYLIIKKPKQAFKLSLYSSNQFYNLSTLSGENFVLKERKKKRKPEKVTVVAKVTPAALVMLNELNALILDLKDFNKFTSNGSKLVLKKKLERLEFEEESKVILSKIKSKYK